MANYIQTLDTHEKLYEGAIVNLARFPGIKWILHIGWYTYNNKSNHGWYFSSIPSQTVSPVSNQDLYQVYIISDGQGSESYDTPSSPDRPPKPGCDCDRPPYPGPYDPWDDDKPAPITMRYKRLLDAAFVSVGTVADRDRLDQDTIPDGKIIRVNYTDEGKPKYYIWSATKKKFEDWDIVFTSTIQSDIDNATEELRSNIETNQKSILDLYNKLEDNDKEDAKVDEKIKEQIDKLMESINQSFEEYQKKIDDINKAITQASGSFLTSIKVDKNSALEIDNTDPQNPLLSLQFHVDDEDTPGNVEFHQDEKGLWARVKIPEAKDAKEAPGEKVIKVEDREISSTLNIEVTKDKDNRSWLVLTGIDGQEVSKVDVTDFLQADLLKSANLVTKLVDGVPHKVIDLVFFVEGGETSQISVDVQDLVDVYTAADDGGLKVNDNKEFSIDNNVEAFDGSSVKTIDAKFGDKISIPFVVYNKFGLITGQKTLEINLPSIITIKGGSVGGTNKLVSNVTLDENGELSGDSIDIDNDLSSAQEGKTSIPTTSAVKSEIDKTNQAVKKVDGKVDDLSDKVNNLDNSNDWVILGETNDNKEEK